MCCDVGTITVGARADPHLVNAPSHAYFAYRPGMPLTHSVYQHGTRVPRAGPGRRGVVVCQAETAVTIIRSICGIVVIIGIVERLSSEGTCVDDQTPGGTEIEKGCHS